MAKKSNKIEFSTKFHQHFPKKTEELEFSEISNL